MKILHTADWHLGRKLYGKDLFEEQQLFLDWLILQIKNYDIELLIIAGDIFDNGYPPNESRKQYYIFLTQILRTSCKNVVIIGGNHDSPSTLDAPKEILELLNIFVVGGTTDRIEDEILEIKDVRGELEAVVCAVPFLRDKDVQYSKTGEFKDEREKRIKEAIKTHYEILKDIVLERQYKERNIPILATGHLFAQNVETSESEKDIYVGNLGQIGAEEFPKEFDYVALGHLHRPQIVGNVEYIRYAGSPIPLSFSEIKDKKSVAILDFDKDKLNGIEKIEVPRFREMIVFKGDFETIKTEITGFENREKEVWAEVHLQLTTPIPNANAELQNLIDSLQKNLTLLRIIPIANAGNNTLDSLFQSDTNLNEINVNDVFEKLCISQKIEQDKTDELKMLFTTLQNLVDEGKINP